MSAEEDHARLHFETWPAAVYAIGDVHGCLSQLKALEREIIADGASIPGEKWLLTLGDYVDRGPDSAGVIEHLIAAPPTGFKRFALLGNHEQAMLDFLDNPFAYANWLDWGGRETLRSYGVEPSLLEDLLRRPDGSARRLREKMPAAHLQFLDGLSSYLLVPGFLFVHAGLKPGVPIERQELKDLIWIRGEFHRAAPRPGLTVVHGHTPVDVPMIVPGRIDIDTGCCFSGVLTGLRVMPGGDIKIIEVGG